MSQIGKKMQGGKRCVDMPDTSIAHATGTHDYHGVNYYTHEMVCFDPTLPSNMFVRRFAQPDPASHGVNQENNVEEIYPAGLYRVLKSVHRRTRGNKPLY